MNRNRYVDEGFLIISAHVVTQGPNERARLKNAQEAQAVRQVSWKLRALPIDRQRLEFNPKRSAAA